MKILVDMNLSPEWTLFLAAAGFDAVHWSAVGPSNAPDREVMAWAAVNDCVLLTADLDFGAILAATQDTGPSVIQVRGERLRPQHIGALVVQALHQARRDLIAGALISVDVAQARVRILPLQT